MRLFEKDVMLTEWNYQEALQHGWKADAVSAVLAFRVWMGSWGLDDPEAGGIHLAPTLGETRGVRTHYELQWLETVRGYIVEVVEASLFVILAVMARSLMAF